MTGNQPGTSAPAAQEFKVRVPNEKNKKFSIMRFKGSNTVDFTRCIGPKIERENNLKEYKTANDLEQMPKFGAGSEFGREQKEEAKKKKYGIMVKKYNAEDQPWILKTGGKAGKRFKGIREGTISDNTSYFIFTQCPDGAFEAFPIDDWYTFTPMLKYKFLNAEEAEEEFSKRDKTLNKFSVMLRRRIKHDEEDVDDADDEEGSKNPTKGKEKTKKKKKKGFMLTEMDDWSDKEDENAEDDDEDEDDNEEKKKKPAKKTGKKDQKKKRKLGKSNDADEAIEESDDGDNDDKEVDYITDTSSDEELDVLNEKNDEKGVVDEEGLRKINESGDESEEEDKKENEKQENPDEKSKKKVGEDSASSESSGSDSDSDALEEEGKYSALFMQSKKKPGSRPSTPDNDQKGVKRKATESDENQAKKVCIDSPLPSPSSSGAVTSSPTPPPSAGVTEENIRRYLMRKPMQTKDILQKFNANKTGMKKDEIVATVAQILKRINPDKIVIGGKNFFHIKKTDTS